MTHDIRLTFAVMFLFVPLTAAAHDGHTHEPSEDAREKIHRLNTQAPKFRLASQRRLTANPSGPAIAKLFEPFADKVKTRFDRDSLFVESNGIPDHPMMIGITAWQQQVPIPQPYTGENSWQIPLNPVPARNPMSAKTNFFRGAIALAVNGVPIFNPIKNDGRTDTFLAGELDQWGGHCGRADDYHYHIAPVHLEKIVGKGNAIAVALDGYPIYGYNDPDGKPPTNLDWLNGHKDAAGNYHYHATKTYPYLNGGFYGEVEARDGQVSPQPRGRPLRPASRPLRGAKITGFVHPAANRYRVDYDVYGEKRSIDYTVAADGSAVFKYIDSSGTKTETYRPRPPRDDRRPPRGEPDRRRPEQGGRPSKRGRPGEQRPRPDRPREQASNRSGPPNDTSRQPWIVNHASELDLNGDNIIAREEVTGEARKVFAGYDRNSDRKLSVTELNGRSSVRSAMGGYLRTHAKELDVNGDEFVTESELNQIVDRMFRRMDRNSDGRISAGELNAPQSGKPEKFSST